MFRAEGSMSDALRDLTEQLLRCADGSLLDVPLDGLARTLGDAGARELFATLHEAGEGASLREVLTDDRLERWVTETCTRSEEDTLMRQLHRWLRKADGAADDPTRLVRVREL